MADQNQILIFILAAEGKGQVGNQQFLGGAFSTIFADPQIQQDLILLSKIIKIYLLLYYETGGCAPTIFDIKGAKKWPKINQL